MKYYYQCDHQIKIGSCITLKYIYYILKEKTYITVRTRNSIYACTYKLDKKQRTSDRPQGVIVN